LLITAAAIAFPTIGFESYIILFYLILFGILTIIGEFIAINKYFGYHHSYFGRGCFFVFVGVLSYYPGTQIHLAFMIIILIVAFTLIIFWLFYRFSSTNVPSLMPLPICVSQKTNTTRIETQSDYVLM